MSAIANSRDSRARARTQPARPTRQPCRAVLEQRGHRIGPFRAVPHALASGATTVGDGSASAQARRRQAWSRGLDADSRLRGGIASSCSSTCRTIASSRISLGNSLRLITRRGQARPLTRDRQRDRPVIGVDEAEQGAASDDLVVEQHLTVVARIDLCEVVIGASQSERDQLAPCKGRQRVVLHRSRAARACWRSRGASTASGCRARHRRPRHTPIRADTRAA